MVIGAGLYPVMCQIFPVGGALQAFDQPCLEQKGHEKH